MKRVAKDVTGGCREERGRVDGWFYKKVPKQRHWGAKETVLPPHLRCMGPEGWNSFLVRGLQSVKPSRENQDSLRQGLGRRFE